MNGLRMGGGKCSKASQLVNTRAPRRSGCSVATIWAIAPPVSLPTNTTSSRFNAARNSLTIDATPAMVRTAPAPMAVV
jgi:hypothetical protein